MVLRRAPFGLMIGESVSERAGAQRLGYYACLRGQAGSFQFEGGIMYNVNGPAHCLVFGDTLIIRN